MPTATPFNNLITFSRGSNATVTGSNGLIQWAPNNLLTNSEQIDNGNWQRAEVTITANSATAPDGTITADTLAATTTGTFRYVRQAPTLSTGVTYTLSVYLKYKTARWVWLLGETNGDAFAVFDVLNGVVGSATAGVTHTITPVGDGWYRCTATFTVSSVTATQQVGFGLSDTNTTSNPSATAGIDTFVWGAQLELGSVATTYNSTTVKNQLGFSEAFNDTAWTKVAASIVTGAQANPVNGLFNAQKFMEDTTNAEHIVRVNIALPTIFNTLYGYSVYAKAAGRTQIRVTDNNVVGATFTLTGTGATSNISGGVTASISPLADGWYRCFISVAAASVNGRLALNLVSSGNTTYTGDGNSGVYIYGAQLSDSASLDPYVPTPGAAPSSTAFYGPRFDFDPVTRAPRGILIEEQRTNIVTYSDQFDNSAWTKTRCQIVANVDPAAATFGPELGDAALLNIRPATGGTVTRSGGIITFAAPASGLSTSISQEITVTPGRLYRLRGRMRFVSGTLGGQAIQIRTASGGGGSETGSVFYTGGSSFQTLDLYFVPTVSPVFATFLAINGSTIEVEEASYSVRELIGGGLIAPDGTSTADTLVEDYTTSTHPVSAAVTLTAAAHTMAFYVKASGRSWTQLNLLGTANAFANFNVSTGTLGTVGAAATATITPVGNGWYRCTMTATTGAGANTVAIYPASADNTVSYTGTGIPSLFLWGAQLEAGAFATSYIPTVASTVTRSADIATISGQNFAQWYRQDEGAFVVNFDVLSTAINADIMIASTSGSFNPGSSGIYGTSTPVTYVRSNSAYISTLATIGSISSNVPAKIAYAYSASSAANSLNAGAISSNTPTGPMPTTVNQLAWFTTGVTGLTHSGHIRSINFVPARAADFQLQALTAQSIVDYFYLQTAAGDQLIAGNDDYLYSLPILG